MGKKKKNRQDVLTEQQTKKKNDPDEIKESNELPATSDERQATNNEQSEAQQPETKEPEVEKKESNELPATSDERQATNWAFPTKSACPRCKVLDTEATSTQGDRQYRRCRRAVCRHKYSVKGTPVKTGKK